MKIPAKVKDKFRTIYRKYGWKAVVAVFLYYVIRDLTLYVAIPYFALSKI